MTRGWQVTRSTAESSDATAALVELDRDALQPSADQRGDVTVDVTWSSLNYKDALAFTGNPGVARISPLVPGIDVVGTVAASAHPAWAVGDRVLLNGAGAGETRHGGLAGRAVLAVLALERHGVALLGVKSTLTDLPLRQQAWQRLATELDAAVVDRIARTIPFSEARSAAAELLASHVRGRLSVSIGDLA